MTEGAFGALAALAGLGAFHGINPAMGWLFAVALGLQEGRRAAVWQAVAAIALGHAAAIAAAVALGAVALRVVPGPFLQALVATLLVALGIASLWRSRHPRVRASMRVGFVGLAAWSFLVASAHGAGLMVLPVVLGASGGASAHGAHAAASTAVAGVPGVMAVMVHTAAYLTVTAAIALVVFEKVGVGLLRRAWINLDVIWAVALIVTGGAAMLLL